jgi:hypothetical protein
MGSGIHPEIIVNFARKILRSCVLLVINICVIFDNFYFDVEQRFDKYLHSLYHWGYGL